MTTDPARPSTDADRPTEPRTEPDPEPDAEPDAEQHTEPRRRQTRAEQQAETRARLLEAAAAEFGAHGFAGASIDAITQRAGYTRGAFYSNFPDKATLLRELSEDRMAAFTATALPGLLAASEPERIAEAARFLVTDDPALELLLLVEVSRLRANSPEAAEVLSQLTSRTLGFVDEVLTATEDETRRSGAAVPSDTTDRTVVTHALLAAVLGVLVLRHLGVAVEPQVAEVLLRGVLTPEEPR